MKKAALLITLLCGLNLRALPAHADAAEVRRQEEQLQQLKHGSNPELYYDQLLYLAGVYQQNGMREKADAAFREAIAHAKEMPDNNAKVVEIKRMWASNLRQLRYVYSFPNGTDQATQQAYVEQDHEQHKKDVLKSQDILKEVLSEIENVSIYQPVKPNVYFDLIESDDTNQSKYETKIDWAVSVEEAKPDLTKQQIQSLCGILGRLADLHNTNSQIRLGMAHSLIKNHGGEGPSRISDQDFTAAERYRLRALKLWNRLPVTDPLRINAQRQIVLFYLYCKKPLQADQQSATLAKMLGSNDLEKLFPTPPPCPACGRG